MDNKKSNSVETEIKEAAGAGNTGAAENTSLPGGATENTASPEDDAENADTFEDDAKATADSGDHIADQEESKVAPVQPETTMVPDEEMKDLVAIYPILYLSHQYKVGDRLPANNPDMVQAWLNAGTAVWKSSGVETPKANSRTAEPGLPGQAVYQKSQDGDDLVGKIPMTRGRKK